MNQAKEVAVNLGKQLKYVHIDQVRANMFGAIIGNLSSVFSGPNWKNTGTQVRSTRPESRGRRVTVWEYIGPQSPIGGSLPAGFVTPKQVQKFPFSVGDKVNIINHPHPWIGNGVIVKAEFSKALNEPMYDVKMSDGPNTGKTGGFTKFYFAPVPASAPVQVKLPSLPELNIGDKVTVFNHYAGWNGEGTIVEIHGVTRKIYNVRKFDGPYKGMVGGFERNQLTLVSGTLAVRSQGGSVGKFIVVYTSGPSWPGVRRSQRESITLGIQEKLGNFVFGTLEAAQKEAEAQNTARNKVVGNTYYAIAESKFDEAAKTGQLPDPWTAPAILPTEKFAVMFVQTKDGEIVRSGNMAQTVPDKWLNRYLFDSKQAAQAEADIHTKEANGRRTYFVVAESEISNVLKTGKALTSPVAPVVPKPKFVIIYTEPSTGTIFRSGNRSTIYGNKSLWQVTFDNPSKANEEADFQNATMGYEYKYRAVTEEEAKRVAAN